MSSADFLCGISCEKGGEDQGSLKQLPMTALASISIQSIIAVLGEEQTRKIKHSQEIMDLLIESCWQGVKA